MKNARGSPVLLLPCAPCPMTSAALWLSPWPTETCAWTTRRRRPTAEMCVRTSPVASTRHRPAEREPPDPPPRLISHGGPTLVLAPCAVRLTPAPALCCAQFAQEAASKVQSMAKQSTASDQTRMGMLFAETDDELAYLVFVAPDYPERVAKQLVDKHARAVETMAADGARARATCHTHPTREGSTLHAHRLPPRHPAPPPPGVP